METFGLLAHGKVSFLWKKREADTLFTCFSVSLRTAVETLVSGQHEVIHDQNDEVKGKRSAERVHGVHQPGDVARGYLTFFPWKGV